ncbi:SHOCT domain-containing protein [Oenococcus oeni]
MEVENKLIVRRLIAGILLLLASFRGFYISYSVFHAEKQFSFVTQEKMQTFAEYVLTVAIVSFIISIIFLITCKRKPEKMIEYSITGMVLLVFLITAIYAIGITAYTAGILSTFNILMLFLTALGLPGKKGFKGMPFITQEEAAKPIQKSESTAKAENKNDLQQLIELKKLLDSGVISQEDFDTKKKQILGL